jgi:hypothetical protein
VATESSESLAWGREFRERNSRNASPDEAICENVAAAVQAVMRNKGAPGVDGMTVK